MNGEYNFGDMYSFDRSMLVYNEWWQHGIDGFNSGNTDGMAGNPEYYGFIHDMNKSAMSDLNCRSTYWAGYIMPEINIGKWIMFIPGVRYEFMKHDMKAYYGNEVLRKYSIHQDVAEAFQPERKQGCTV